MRKKFVYPENMLDKNQIMNLIIQDELNYQHQFHNEDQNPSSGDLALYAEMDFGPMIFDEGFSRYSDKEIQEWYYREYLPDRESDIADGHDRGQ